MADDEREHPRALVAMLDAATVLVLVWALWINAVGNAPLHFYVARVCWAPARRFGIWGTRAELAYRQEITP